MQGRNQRRTKARWQPVRVAARRFGLGVALALAGCQSPEANELPRPNLLPPLPRQTAAPAARTGAILPVAARLGPQEGGVVAPESLMAEAPLKEPAKDAPPEEPEVLPRPEKIAEPESSAPAPAAAAVPLTFTQALATGLARNPDLVTLRGQVRVNRAMVGVARTYIWNPFVQAEYFPTGTPFVPNTPGQPASGAGFANYYIWAMQRFELAHQTHHRTQSALAALDQVQWNIFQGELLNVAQTTRLYLTALYQKEVHDLALETAQLNERLARIVEQRFKANLARASDVTTATVAARQARQQAELTETAYRGALLALRQQLNVPLSMPLVLGEKLEDMHWLAVRPPGASEDDSVLAADLTQGRPDIMAAQAGVRVSLANFKLARAAMIPDIQAGPIYQTADDTTRYLGLRLQMDIPIWNNGSPLARQRHAELSQQELTHEQLKVRAALEAQLAINLYEANRRMVAKQTPAAPGATATELKEIIRLFELGQADILAVLNTQSSLLQERRNTLDLLNQLGLSAAAVIQATGLPPERVVHPPSGSCLAANKPGPTTPPQP